MAAVDLFSMTPADASSLSAKQLCEELERRGLRPSGFLFEDATTLQRIFDAEFSKERAEREQAAEAAAAAAQAAEAERRRQE